MADTEAAAETQEPQEQQEPTPEAGAPKEDEAEPMAGAAADPPAQEPAEAAFEVDVDLSQDLSQEQAAAPPSGDADSPSAVKKKGPKEISFIGSSLDRHLSARDQDKNRTAGDSQSGRKPRPIIDRYAAEVREADRSRKIGYLPMQKQIEYSPAGLDVARDLRADLNGLSQAAGGAHLIGKGGGWDALFGKQEFQKRMQFLHANARTGHFIEQYGADGEYEGDFMHGMRHGKGRYEFREEVYDGEWKWDHRHGWGELKSGDGTTMKGEWQNDKLNGYASVVDPKGTVVYEGEFKDGKRHGLGRQVFESGDTYDGGWQHGRLHDRGVYYFTNGDRLYGMWREGIYDGVGVFHYADGSISRREYKDGLLMSVQDYEHESQRFGKTLTRDGMQKHTRDRDFPKDVFLLSSV